MKTIWTMMVVDAAEPEASVALGFDNPEVMIPALRLELASMLFPEDGVDPFNPEATFDDLLEMVETANNDAGNLRLVVTETTIYETRAERRAEREDGEPGTYEAWEREHNEQALDRDWPHWRTTIDQEES